MAFPPGISPKTVTIGIGSFFNGDIVSGTATISAPVNVVHTPSNRPIFSGDMTRTFTDGQATWDLVPTDQAGLNRVDWTYKLKVQIAGALVQPDPIYFTLPTAGPTVVDLDGLVVVPSSAGVPVSVDVLTTDDFGPIMAEQVNDPSSPTSVALRSGYVALDGSTTMTGILHGLAAELVGNARALFAKTTSPTDHTATIYQASTTGVDTAAALNVVSDNPQSSTMYLSGTEKQRGTLKASHRGYADGSDASASVLSVDLQTAGSAARGLYVRSSTGGVVGDGIAVRVSAAEASVTREDFVVKATGRVGIGTGLGSAPAGQLEVAPADDTTPGLSIKGRTSGTNLAEFRRPSDGAVRTRVSNTAQFVTQEVAFFAGPAVQLGSTSVQVGGGSLVVGITNAATVPTTNPVGGGVLYAVGGALFWRGSNGTVTQIAAA